MVFSPASDCRMWTRSFSTRAIASVVPFPYSTAGNCPARRSRRATPLPAWSRLCTTSFAVSILPSLPLVKERTHRIITMNTLDRFPQKRRHRQNLDTVPRQSLRAQRNRIGDYELFQVGSCQALHGRPRKDRMGRPRIHPPRPSTEQRSCRFHQCPCGIDHIIDYEHIAPSNIAHDMHRFSDVFLVAIPTFINDTQRHV